MRSGCKQYPINPMKTREYKVTFITRTPNEEQEIANDFLSLLQDGIKDCSLNYKLVLEEIVHLGEDQTEYEFLN